MSNNKEKRFCSVCGKELDDTYPVVTVVDPFLQTEVKRNDICDSARCRDTATLEGKDVQQEIGHGIFINNIKTTIRAEHLAEPQKTHGLVDQGLISTKKTKKILKELVDGKASNSRSSKKQPTNKGGSGKKAPRGAGKNKGNKKA